MSSQSPLIDLPVIDLSFLQSKSDAKSEELKSECCSKIRDACEELGFFHVVGHGIDPTLVQTVDSIARDMFALPTEVKERAVSPIFYNGYVPPRDGMPESMFFPRMLLSNSISDVANDLWPPGNPKFCETFRAYGSAVADLANAIIELLLRSLGLDIYKYLQSEFGKCVGWVSMNYYRAGVGVNDESTERLLSSKAHTDISCITVLYEDDVGGLQVRTKKGSWIDVRPRPHSFVVNIADTFRMWCNDRYRSAEHRVLHGGRKNRLSLAFQWDFPDDKEICAPEELIDKAHPRVYRAVTVQDYKEYFRQRGPSMNNYDAFLLS